MSTVCAKRLDRMEGNNHTCKFNAALSNHFEASEARMLHIDANGPDRLTLLHIELQEEMKMIFKLRDHQEAIKFAVAGNSRAYLGERVKVYVQEHHVYTTQPAECGPPTYLTHLLISRNFYDGHIDATTRFSEFIMVNKGDGIRIYHSRRSGRHGCIVMFAFGGRTDSWGFTDERIMVTRYCSLNIKVPTYYAVDICFFVHAKEDAR